MSGGCPSGKRAYPTEAAADQALSAIWSRPWPGGRPLERRPYQCPDCGRWHLTKQPPREEAA